jgi:signal transduction histidine kinase
METITTAYIFGILTVVAITLVITTVIGIVKILKQQRMIENLDNEIQETHRGFNRRIDEEFQSLNGEIELQYREFNRRIDETYQHTDSRVDKLEGKLITKINN